MTDVVVDTNVLMHADNVDELRHFDAISFLQQILAGVELLCVDEIHAMQESANRSRIVSEYLRILRFGSFGSAVIQHLARSGRIVDVSPRVSNAVARVIRTHVLDKTDVVFVKVAFNSQRRMMISHDLADIPIESRDALRTKLGVSVVEASDYVSPGHAG